MKNIHRIIAMMICLLMLFGISGCENQNGENTCDQVSDFCVINGKKMYFLDDGEKAKLREPLIKLLSNETREIYADSPMGEIIGYEAYDPDLPTIPEGYACGLYDVSGDGIPELLVHPRGYFGSSGTVTYFVYDIFTGEAIGSIDGGNGESWCVYYITETDELRSVGSYWRRGGWSERYRVMTFLRYEDDHICGEELYLYSHLSIDGETIETGDVNEDGVPIGKWVESYPYSRYSVYGEDAYLDDYYAEIDWFHKNGIRIPETELQMINWWNATRADDRFVRAEQMADALLTTTQKFIVPTEKHSIYK